MVAAAVILLVGLGASIAGGLLWRSRVQREANRTFQATAANVTATLGSSLQGDTDFVTTLHGLVTMLPGLSNQQFGQWYTQLQGSRRLVGSIGTSVVAAVPARQVPAFAAKIESDPTFHALTRGSYTIIPSAQHSRYCLLQAFAGAPLPPTAGPLVQLNFCSTARAGAALPPGIDPGIGTALQLAEDTGTYVVTRFYQSGVASVFAGAAVYRMGAPRGSVAQRRAALLGWIGASFAPQAIIASALATAPKLHVSLYRAGAGGASTLLAQAGAQVPASAATRTAVVQAQGPWRVTVRGVPQVAGLSATTQGLLVIGAGAALTLLVLTVMLVLGRSRQRAITMVAAKTAELSFQALHDSLTGLPNRALVLDRAERMLARARRHDVPVAAMYVDLDGFKQVNDTFGHGAGDELLRVVAARLKATLRESDTVGRLAGDEFIVLLESASLEAGPELVAQRILDVLIGPITLEAAPNTPLTVTASIGIAMGQRPDPERLFRDADLALYEAKAAGKNRYALFEQEMQVAAQERLDLEFELTGALDAGQLFLMYQPIFDLRSETATGVEALLRWRHPTRGIVAPDAFIPLAEQNGMIVEIGRWVLDRACAQAAAWHAAGHDLTMAVNVSGRQLDEDSLVEYVRAALERHDIDPPTLTLEITETALMRDAEASARRLVELKALGVKISIDDFGTGYSSLAYLRQFPIDALKIDRSFISGMASSSASTALIHTLVQLGKTLQIETLGEGIEQQAQLRRLQREDCDSGQGFLFARPLTARGMERFLKQPVGRETTSERA